jgi:hypothetical protein
MSKKSATLEKTWTTILYFFIFIFVILMIPVITRIGFWGDDFINMNQFADGIGEISKSDGKIVANLYWFFSGIFFGTSSVIPYALLNILVATLGIYLFSHSINFQRGKGYNFAWLLLPLLTSGVIFPIYFWSSNIVHSSAIFFIGLGVYLIDKLQKGDRRIIIQIACGLSWFMVVVSNPLYIATLIIPISHAGFAIRKNKTQKRDLSFAPTLFLAFASIIFFIAIALPRTRQQQPYSKMSLSYISSNLEFYSNLILSNRQEVLIFGFLAAGSLFFTIFMSLKSKSISEPILIIASVGVVLPILVQGQQTGIHYFTVPVLLMSGALLKTFERFCDISQGKMFSLIMVSVMCANLFLAHGSQNVRNWFVSNPYGYAVKDFRDQVALLSDPEKILCITSGMQNGDWLRFKGGMANELGFSFYPIFDSRVILEETSSCPLDSNKIRVVADEISGTYRVED